MRQRLESCILHLLAVTMSIKAAKSQSKQRKIELTLESISAWLRLISVPLALVNFDHRARAPSFSKFLLAFALMLVPTTVPFVLMRVLGVCPQLMILIVSFWPTS